MKLRKLTTVLMLVVAALVAQPTMGQTVNEFTGNGDGISWNVGDNWRFDVPNNTQRAWIPVGKSCVLKNTGAPGVADSLDVDGTLTLGTTQTLTIDTDSDIYGTLILGDAAEKIGGSQLLITGDLTINGPGGKIKTYRFSKIDEASGGPFDLTLASNCGAQLGPACAMTIIGEGEINCGLINNGFVIADLGCEHGDAECSLSLNGVPKSGSGEWQSQGNWGWLHVNAEVTGSGTWRIKKADVNMTSLIEIDACCSLTGDVILKNGILQVDQSFCTTGDLTLASVNNGERNTEPSINVDATTTATFGYPGLACPSCP